MLNCGCFPYVEARTRHRPSARRPCRCCTDNGGRLQVAAGPAQPPTAATYSLVLRAPERQKASSGRGSSPSNSLKAAISCGDW